MTNYTANLEIQQKMTDQIQILFKHNSKSAGQFNSLNKIETLAVNQNSSAVLISELIDYGVSLKDSFTMRQAEEK